MDGPVFLLPVFYHARNAVERVHGFLFQVFIGGDPQAGEDEQADRRDDQEHQDYQAGAAGGFLGPFQQPESLGTAQQDQGHRGKDAEHDGQGHPPGVCFLDIQEGVGFLHADGAAGALPVAFRDRLRLLQAVLEQVIGADAEKLRQLDDSRHIRHGLGALPLGNSLPADIQLFRQFFLRPAALLSQVNQFVREDHYYTSSLFCPVSGQAQHSRPGRCRLSNRA